MMSLPRTLAIIASTVLAATPAARATSMLQPTPVKLVVDYENGDRLAFTCPVEEASCRIEARVNRRLFRLTREDVRADIVPDDPKLYSGTFSGRDRYFSLEFSVICPDNPDKTCRADALFEAGEDVQVTIYEAR